MAYYTFPPPFYSSSAPPFYATSTTIPVPSPNLNFNHGYTPPSPNPYSSHESPPNPYAYGSAGYPDYHRYYQQQPHHFYSQPQPPPPYSPSPPYHHHPPYQPIDVIQRSFDEILQISQGSVNEFTQICQKSKNDLRASHESIKASLNSIKDSFETFCKQEHFQEDEEDPQEPSEILQEQLQEELVDEETEDPKVETETFTIEGTPPKTAVKLTQMGMETTTSQEQRRCINAAVEDKKPVCHAPSLPPPKPPEMVAFPQLKTPDVSIIPAPPPEPPDRVFVPHPLPPPLSKPPVNRSPTRPPPPSPPPPKPPDPTPNTNPTPTSPPKPPDVSHQAVVRQPIAALHSRSMDMHLPQLSDKHKFSAAGSQSSPLNQHQSPPLDQHLFSANKSRAPNESLILLKYLQPIDVHHVSSFLWLPSAHTRPINVATVHTFLSLHTQSTQQPDAAQVFCFNFHALTYVQPVKRLKEPPFPKALHQPFNPLPLPNFRSPPYIKSTIHEKHFQPTTTSHVPIHLLRNATNTFDSFKSTRQWMQVMSNGREFKELPINDPAFVKKKK